MARSYTENYGDNDDDANGINLGNDGEKAFSDAFGGYVEPSGDGDDGGIDVVVDGVTFDVKTTEYETGHLLVRSDRKHYHNTDAYVLVIKTEDGFNIVGALTASEVYAEKPRFWPNAHNHIFEQSDLRPVDEVIADCY